MYRAQLAELLTNYGPIFEVWHDGANGGDGYYGGAREKRVIDKRTYYDWPRTWELVRKLQPGAVIFSDVGPDVRWVGNEKGIANETCWATYDPVGENGGPASPGDVRARDSGTGTRNGKHWLPAECDVSIRPGWFWHERENSRVKTPEQLVDLYFKSVGRGASFLLNVPPDRRGLLHEADVASLAAFGEWRRKTFTGPRPAAFNVVRLREDIRLGQRIERFTVEYRADGEWRPFAAGTSVGSCRLLRGDRVTGSDVRVRAEAPADPVLSEVATFLDGGL
jgi:alpha-L-fucosidase